MSIHLFTGVFWGIYFLIVGSAALIISITNMRISLFRVAVGIFLVYVGLVTMFGGQFDVDPRAVLMARVTAHLNRSGEHSVVFGEGIFTIDEPRDGERLRFEFSSVFASTTIRIPRDVPVKVSASSVFGSVTTPDGRSSSFGEHTYTSPGYSDDGESIYIAASAVFGSVNVIRR